MVRVLGLDLSLRSSGVVVLEYNPATGKDEVIHESTVGKELRKATEEDRIKRFGLIASHVLGVVKKYEIVHVAIEAPAYSRLGRQTELGGLQGVVRTQLYYGLGVVPTLIAVTSARKNVLGKGFGTSKKGVVIPMLKEKYGIAFECEDKADAYVIAKAYCKDVWGKV